MKAKNKRVNVVNAWVEQRRVRTRVKRSPSVNSIDNRKNSEDANARSISRDNKTVH